MSRRLGIGDAKDIARSRGGICLSDSYGNAHDPLHWRCQDGHEWTATLASVRGNGSWCPQCARIDRRLQISVAYETANARKGLCLSNQYTCTKDPMLWRCAHGHTWSASLGSILYHKSWCPLCARRLHRREQEIRSIFERIFAGRVFPTRRPEFLRGFRGAKLELDGYCEDLGLVFEYHGEQHYQPDHFFHGFSKEVYAAQVQRDRQKIALCEAAGIRLVVVPHMVKLPWDYVRLCLLRWFLVSEVFPVQLTP